MDDLGTKSEVIIIIMIFFIFLALLPIFISKKENSYRGYIKFMSITNAVLLIPSLDYNGLLAGALVWVT